MSPVDVWTNFYIINRSSVLHDISSQDVEMALGTPRSPNRTLSKFVMYTTNSYHSNPTVFPDFAFTRARSALLRLLLLA